MARQRSKHVAIKVTEHEFIRLKERVKASGLTQTQYALHSLLYGRVVVVGTRENIDYLIGRIEEIESNLENLYEKVQKEIKEESYLEISEIRNEYACVLKTLLEIIHEADLQVKK